jgi:hypothetical protein
MSSDRVLHTFIRSFEARFDGLGETGGRRLQGAEDGALSKNRGIRGDASGSIKKANLPRAFAVKHQLASSLHGFINSTRHFLHDLFVEESNTQLLTRVPARAIEIPRA